MAPTDEEIAGLYGVPLEEFTAARDRLADALRERGDRQMAARVKKLRRPSVAAWAVNHLARRSPRDVQELLSVGEAVRAAQRTGFPAAGRQGCAT